MISTEAESRGYSLKGCRQIVSNKRKRLRVGLGTAGAAGADMDASGTTYLYNPEFVFIFDNLCNHMVICNINQAGN